MITAIRGLRPSLAVIFFHPNKSKIMLYTLKEIDAWIENSPLSDFSNFCEDVSENYDPYTYNWMDKQGFIESDKETTWMRKCFDKGYDVNRSTEIIEGLFIRYIASPELAPNK